MNELKSTKLKKTKYWPEIKNILISQIKYKGIYELSTTPRNKDSFQTQYANFVDELHKQYELPINIDIVNNAKFTEGIKIKMEATSKFSYWDSVNEKGIQIADLMAFINKDKRGIGYNSKITDDLEAFFDVSKELSE